MFDCHVHSTFSSDSIIEPTLGVKKAIELGLAGMAFTDHLDYDYPSYGARFYIDFGKYINYLDNLKLKYKDKLKILKGIEVGLQPQVIEKSSQVIKGFNFDQVLASIHVVDKKEVHNGDFSINKTSYQSYYRYFEEVYYIINSFMDFDLLAHIDLVRRYVKEPLKLTDFQDIIDSILKKLADNGKGIEVNTSGYRYNLESPLPQYDIIKRFKTLGGEIVSLSSDSHSIKYIGYKFKETKNMIKEAGFDYLAYFENREVKFYSI